MKRQETEIIKQYAKNIGFSLCGFASVSDLNEEIDKLKIWINKGFNADMHYIKNTILLRTNPANLLTNAKSVIVLLKNYFSNYALLNDKAKIAKYAIGKDYHIWMKDKLNLLINFLKNIYTKDNYLAFCDSGPIMEKIWAQKAGLGWLGKNTLLINPELGSFCFIGIIITTIDFLPDNAMNKNYCNNCNKCIKACPTKALIEPGILNANKCISYLTIEKKGNYTNDEAKLLNGWIFGCDICQNVCPYNKNATYHNEPFFEPIKELNVLNDKINELSKSQFNKLFASSSIKRCGLNNLIRNLTVS